MPNHRRIDGVVLDENDRRLIEALDRNARTSIADLARLIGLSPQSTSDRVKRLEDLAVITGFTVRLDPTALGLGIGAYIRIRPASATRIARRSGFKHVATVEVEGLDRRGSLAMTATSLATTAARVIRDPEASPPA